MPPPPLSAYYTVTFTCNLCKRIFPSESAIRNHFRSAYCLQRHRAQGYDAVVLEEEEPATPLDEQQPTGEEGNNHDAEVQNDASQQGSPGGEDPFHDDPFDDMDDTSVAQERSTGMLVRALLVSGQNKGPLPAHGQRTLLDLIHDPTFNPQDLLVRTPNDVKQYIKILVEEDDCLLRNLDLKLQPGDPKHWKKKSLAIYGTNALDACINMVSSMEAEKWMTWECEGPEEEFTGPLGANRARHRERALRDKYGDDVFYVPVSFFSDKTHLNIRGTHKSHPGFLKLCGWKQPFCYTRRAARLIVLLPDLPATAWDPASPQGRMFPSSNAWQEYLKMRKQDLHHAALDKVLQPLKDHSRYIKQDPFQAITKFSPIQIVRLSCFHFTLRH